MKSEKALYLNAQNAAPENVKNVGTWCAHSTLGRKDRNCVKKFSMFEFFDIWMLINFILVRVILGIISIEYSCIFCFDLILEFRSYFWFRWYFHFTFWLKGCLLEAGSCLVFYLVQNLLIVIRHKQIRRGSTPPREKRLNWGLQFIYF